ncbi:MAG TPA: glycosyltransferase family 2 protein [Patescibacteria group bacterium]|jgi:glycosyltransferase involved in cell wall biosynthesis|nr:glycosyltransferase family 2 protein [Patescibacteria group bacterium]
MKYPISCIVPVYNEGPRVKNVLDVILSSGLVDEVIVVNDGSSDNSAEILQTISGINLINVHPNQGKTHAVKVGIQAARNDLIMMIDSDLLGLDALALKALILPVADNLADMTISLRQNSLRTYIRFGLDFVSGERVFSKKLFPDLNVLDKLPGFALESYINQLLIKAKYRIKIVYWPNVQTPRKSKKAGFYKGLKGDFGMVRQIVRYLGLRGVVKMYRQMLKLKV